MKNSKSLLLAVLLVGFTSSAAMAEEGRAYAAIDVGQASAPDIWTGAPSNCNCSTTATAFRAGLGFQANQNFGVEAGYINTGKFTASATVSGTPVTVGISGSGFQLSAIGSAPISNAFALFVKAGFALINGSAKVAVPGSSASYNQDNSNFTFGLGARFNANDKLAIRVMFEDFGIMKASSTDTGAKVTMLSAGLQVGF